MHVVRSLAELHTACAALRSRLGTLSLVPTMGALHAGHQALVEVAAASGGAVVTSIFVNPLQFGPHEDLSRYPRDEDSDLAMLRAWGCHLAWLPDVTTMYRPGNATTVDVAGPAEGWEGDARPGHFRGVATVCAKLFGQVRPDRAYFGEKDWQQLQVVRRMVVDLLPGLEIVAVRTVREPDGLALSSRNRFLVPQERRLAPRLYATLSEVAAALADGNPTGPVMSVARRQLQQEGFGVDYLALVDGATLQTLASLTPGARLIAAVRLGSVRLLDNVGVTLRGS
jgi:pantoate--beta-alanine ligase